MFDLTDILGVKVTSEPWAGADNVPYIFAETYSMRKVLLGSTPCIFAEPRGETPAIQAIVKHFERLRAAADMPVVLKMNGLSGERRKTLIAARVPFVATGQVYLPFMGVILQERLYNEAKPREKLMPSAQLILFAYLYQDNDKMYTSPLANKLKISSMQVTRAVRQLQKLNMFDVSKDGVQVVITGKANRRALFDWAAPYLLDPVREILYVPRNERVNTLPYAGLSALSAISMLSSPQLDTRAYYSKAEKLLGENSLYDREKQIRIEVWRYPPALLSARVNVADPLSVIVSLRDERNDARVEQAIEGVLKKMWG
jgi:DNA-binding MarR family transcriptional regulator